MLEILELKQFNSYVINTKAGLTGTTTIAQYPCILTENQFFVWVGTTDIQLFDKNTYMNLANLAEEKCATDMYLLLDRENEHKTSFRKMFRVIDADRVPAA